MENKLTLIINGQDEADDKKTAAYPRRRSRRLGRRRRKDNRKFFRLFDWARLTGGGEHQFHVQGELLATPDYSTSSGNFWGPDGSGVNFATAGFNYTEDYNNHLLTAAEEDRIDTFREITGEMDDYAINVDNLTEFVPGKGLVIPEEVTAIRGTDGLLWDMGEQPYFPNWIDQLVSVSFRPIKITNTPDFSASSVTLTVDRSIDVFLSPALYNTNATARDYPLIDTSDPFLPQTWYYVPADIRTITRGTLTDSDWADMFAARFITSADTTAVKEYYLDYFVNNGGVNIETADATAVGPVSLSSGTAGFPLESDGAQNVVTTIAGVYNQGSLMMAVRKHLTASTFEWYYVWANSSIFSPWQLTAPTIASNGRI